MPFRTTDKDTLCVALYNYDKKRDDELQLYKGQRILILEESEDDWWRGRSIENGQDGWFPSNYVEMVSVVQRTLYIRDSYNFLKCVK